MNFAAIFEAEFQNLAEQFCKGGPTFCIVKNIVGNNKGDVRLLTIASSIIVQVLFLSIQKKLKEVFNLHVKCDKLVISRKVNIFSFNLACVSCQIGFFMFDVSTLKPILGFLTNMMY